MPSVGKSSRQARGVLEPVGESPREPVMVGASTRTSAAPSAASCVVARLHGRVEQRRDGKGKPGRPAWRPNSANISARESGAFCANGCGACATNDGEPHEATAVTAIAARSHPRGRARRTRRRPAWEPRLVDRSTTRRACSARSRTGAPRRAAQSCPRWSGGAPVADRGNPHRRTPQPWSSFAPARWADARNVNPLRYT